MKIREKPWWRPGWRYDNDDPISEAVVSENGILVTCALVVGVLIMKVNCNGRTVYGRIGRSVNAANLDHLVNFLQQHEGDSIQSIEDLEFD